MRNPYRYDLDVTEDIQVTGLFEELDELMAPAAIATMPVRRS